jgi:hypothetical protein
MQRGKQEEMTRAVKREWVSFRPTMGLLKSHLRRTSRTVANAKRSNPVRPIRAMARVTRVVALSNDAKDNIGLSLDAVLFPFRCAPPSGCSYPS